MANFRSVSEDEIIARIEGGESIAQIARTFECNRSVLWRWLEADEQRSARARAARTIAAMAWDEKAETVLEDAMDPFELSRAKELAHHYRWRSAKADPKGYGDKLTQEHTGRVSIIATQQDEAL